jgi:FAD/FMN-containing dehydrogenase
MTDIRERPEPAAGDHPPVYERRVSRRRLLLGGAATAAVASATWVAVFRETSSSPTAPDPVAFPGEIPRYRQGYRNWSGEIAVDDVWTCAPRSPAEVVDIVNWAWSAGWTVRARGAMHNWSPLALAPGARPRDVILVDAAALNAVEVDTTGSPAVVTAQAGVLLDDLLTRLHTEGLGLYPLPAPGDITLGGALAIGAHGTYLPVAGARAPAGQSYGSLSNQVVGLTAVVWDAAAGRYELRDFRRDDPDIAALLAHLGRAFITEASLQAGPDYRLRCQSWTDVPADEIFAPPGSDGRTFEQYLADTGRANTIHFAFTDRPWLRIWADAPERPPESVEVTEPYNYPFSDQLAPEVVESLTQGLRDDPTTAPEFGQLQLDAVAAGLAAGAGDLWGWSRTVLNYVRPSTLRVTAGSVAVLTARGDVQRVLHEFYTWWQDALARYQVEGRFPINVALEIRATALDDPADVAVDGAVTPALSALRPHPDHPEWDTAVWLDAITLPGTPDAPEFFAEMERWIYATFAGDHALARPEWAKGWAYTAERGAWTDEAVLSEVIPSRFDSWTTAVDALNRHDPHRIYTSPLLEALLP